MENVEGEERQLSFDATKKPPAGTEAQEAGWWANHQDLILEGFEQAKAAGTLV